MPFGDSSQEDEHLLTYGGRSLRIAAIHPNGGSLKNKPFRISGQAGLHFAKHRSPHLIVQTGSSSTSLLNRIARLSDEIDVAHYSTSIPTGEGFKRTSSGDVVRFVDGVLVDVYSKKRDQSDFETALELFDLLFNEGKHGATTTSKFNVDVVEKVRAALEEQARRACGEHGASSTDERHEDQQGEDAGGSAKSEPETPSTENEILTPFDVLGISPDSTRAQVKTAHLKLCQLCHPDKLSGLSRQMRLAAEEEMKRLNIAREAALGLIERSAA